MADLGGEFNAVESTKRDIVAEGEYKAIMTGATWRTNNAGTGRYLKAEFQIVDDNYNGSKISDMFNLEHPKPDTVKWAKRDFGFLCLAVGVEKPSKTEVLENIEMIISVTHESGSYQGKDYINAVIKGYKKIEAGVPF